MELNIDHIGGYCPVQATGTINGVPFYFRARGDHWTIGIGQDPVDIHLGAPGWYRQVPYDYAGYMSMDVAKELITQCAEEFAAKNANWKVDWKKEGF